MDAIFQLVVDVIFLFQNTVTTVLSSKVQTVSVFFLIGALVGSFINVVIYRLPKMMIGQSICDVNELHPELEDQLKPEDKKSVEIMIEGLYGRSVAPCCDTPIKGYHNIPIISWLALKGACAYCGEKIPKKYVLNELTIAALFSLTAFFINDMTVSVLTCALMSFTIVIAAIDIRHKIIPNSLCFGVSLIMLIAINESILNQNLYSGLFSALAIMMTLDLLNMYYMKKKGVFVIGGGDIKLIAAFSVGLGFQNALILLFLALVVFYVVNKLKGEIGEHPLGQYISALGFGLWLFMTL